MAIVVAVAVVVADAVLIAVAVVVAVAVFVVVPYELPNLRNPFSNWAFNVYMGIMGKP